ncbi:hypothetical protein V6N12_062996 [Hibiscus sabdariffa]|uniref:Uncharacterized protein n=1 Tax=Hibiscus sabdariffa TaxID=183260 RepID=A0ABR2FAH7_9ROSI
MLSPTVTAESITSPPSKNVIIKSADMKDELQKEAVNIAISQWRCNQRHHRDQELEKQNPWLGSASSLAYQFL